VISAKTHHVDDPILGVEINSNIGGRIAPLEFKLTQLHHIATSLVKWSRALPTLDEGHFKDRA
jgi:hypothetical protein